MTKKAFFSLIAAGLVLSSFAAVEVQTQQTAIAKTAKSQWKVFNSPDGSFEVLMPGMPKAMSQTQKTFMGEINLNIFLAQPPKQQVAYVVAYNDFPYSYGEMADPESVLNNARDMALKTTQSKLIRQQDIRSSNNHPGKEIEYVNSGGKITRNRMFFAQGRLYQAIVITTKEQEKYLSKSIRGYLNSFKVVLKK
ncbi:MAG: hypothetical protein ACFB2X_05710 [Rivularia sp. (in: cyanobacteria)]